MKKEPSIRLQPLDGKCLFSEQSLDLQTDKLALQGNSTEMKGPAFFLMFQLCILKTGTASKGWSMHVPSEVTGEIGKTVSLPCTFTHPHQTYDKTLTAIWRVKEPYNGTVVFKCVAHSSSSACKTAVGSKNRYQLLGNPRQNNLSLQIHNLTWNDSSKYFCRVEFSGDVHDKYESRMGIRLQLIAAPRIVNISVQSDEDHSFHAKCTAEGEPLPTLTWTGPLAGNGSPVSSENYQVTKELQHLTHDGRYTCTAVNSLGRAEGAIYFYKYKAGGGSWILVLLFASLGIKALALLLILGFGALWKGDNSMAPTSLLRQQAQESPYENLSRRINSISQRLQD